MSTNNVVLKTVDEFMRDYIPIYQPIYSLFLGKSQQYTEEVGKLNFKRVTTIGDIRAKHITPKDTEMRQVSVTEGVKTFKKYFLSNQFTISTLQTKDAIEQIVAEVLDEHQKQMDELFLLGEGSSAATVVNNGLYWSNDPNYILEGTTQTIAVQNRLYDLHNKVITTAKKADRVAGKKLIVFYGTSILPLYNSLYDTAVKPFKVALQEVLGPNYKTIEMPADCTPESANGWIVANLEQVKLHYTVLPSLRDQGTNDEKLYHWFNFLMGSCMLECLASGAVVRQPAVLASAS